jgi:amidohydrolase
MNDPVAGSPATTPATSQPPARTPDANATRSPTTSPQPSGTTGSRALPTGLADRLSDWLEAHHDDLVAIRRHLHAHPELSGEERETTTFVAEHLLSAGLSPRILPGGTGLLCDLGPPGELVALRADLDALAMEDGKDVPYRSTRPGVAHACGHDVHTTVVLGAGLALHELVGAAGAPVPARLIFQPAEERVPGGAVEVIAGGGLDGVSTIFGLHCDPRLPVGQVGITTGPITSATDMMVIALHGPGGHTARPERTVDLVHLAGVVVTHLPDLVRSHLPDRSTRITFGSLHAGDAPNVIPSVAELWATVRTPEPGDWHSVEAAVRRALDTLVMPADATWQLTYTHGHPPVVNDAVATRRLVAGATTLLGADAVVPTAQSVGGDDFSWYLDRVPGSYARLGTSNGGGPDGGSVDQGSAGPGGSAAPVDLHASCFDVDEGCIPVGIAVLVGAVLAGGEPEPQGSGTPTRP